MCLAESREIELVLRIVRMNEIVGDLVCKREIPREMASNRGGLTEKHCENKPRYQRLAVIALLDITVI
jgi:hypothetical protein